MTSARWLVGLLVCAVSLSLHAVVVTYQADHQTVFPNPERGFTDEINGKVSDSKNHLLVGNEDFFDDEGDRETQRLVVVLYNLYNYKTKALSNKMLQGFDEDMQVLRDKGFKCILRFAYSESDKKDATKDQAVAHIAQLKPYLQKNADVIYVLEAGFVGEWGEWYYSANFGNETQQLNANRRAVLVSLLDACPSDRFLLVRYPLIKTQFLGDEQPLNADSAFSGSDRARIGHHNDAFLNDYGNDGTYGRDGQGPDDDPILRQYIAAETLYVPNGGETNVEDNTLAQTVYTQAEEEMRTYHWSFCGAEYAEQVTGLWRSSGIFERLNLLMGYRFQLVSGTYPDAVPAGGEASVSLTVRNVGFAPLYNARTAYLVLRSDTHTYRLALQTDPRRWLPDSAETVIQQTLTLPSDIEQGTYHLYLHLPDAYASLANNARFAIRMANVNCWDEATGMNDLNAELSVLPATESIPSVTGPTAPQKILRDGKLFILRGESIYTILGGKQ